VVIGCYLEQGRVLFTLLLVLLHGWFEQPVSFQLCYAHKEACLQGRWVQQQEQAASALRVCTVRSSAVSRPAATRLSDTITAISEHPFGSPDDPCLYWYAFTAVQILSLWASGRTDATKRVRSSWR